MTAFPSITTVTDNFATAADPLGAGWDASTPSGGTTSLLKASGGVCTKNQPAAAGFGSQMRSTVYGPDMEAWMRVPTVTTTAGDEIFAIFLRLQQIGAGTTDGYVVFASLAAGADGWEVDRIVNGAQTSIATSTRDIAAGDWVGAKVEDSGGDPVITAHWCPAASDPTLSASWTAVCTVTDSNAAKITGTGKVALEVWGLVTTFDDLRVGTIVTGGGATADPARREYVISGAVGRSASW